MNDILTNIGTVIPADDIYKYNQCVQKYAGHGLPPCHTCSVIRRTACLSVKTAKKLIPELVEPSSKPAFLCPAPDRVPTGNL
jgi:hypothetical protein